MEGDTMFNPAHFLQPVASNEAILDLIPQRPPIVMVDAFYGVDEMTSYSSLTVHADNVFFENGKLREPGLVEHVAQSAAARVGYVCQLEKRPVPVGFIGQVKNFKIHALPSEGDKLCTTVKIESEFGDISIITATTYVEGNLMTECEMKIFLQ